MSSEALKFAEDCVNKSVGVISIKFNDSAVLKLQMTTGRDDVMLDDDADVVKGFYNLLKSAYFNSKAGDIAWAACRATVLKFANDKK